VVHAWQASTSFLRTIREHLNQTFGEQQLGRGDITFHNHRCENISQCLLLQMRKASMWFTGTFHIESWRNEEI
jgi:hypothetical protein